MQTDWLELHARFKVGSLNTTEMLAMIHPDHYADRVNQELICGPRVFSAEVVRKGGSCASLQLWGYECPLGVANDADHLFPYSCGGPTDPRNLVLLCRTHNRMKNDDVHVFPWEQAMPTWVADVVERIRATAFPWLQ
jgi:hypothetical protein